MRTAGGSSSSVVVKEKDESFAEKDMPSEGDTRWVRLYGAARQVKVGPVDRRLVGRLGGTVSAKDLITGVWRNFFPRELKRTRAELPDDEAITGPMPDLPVARARRP